MDLSKFKQSDWLKVGGAAVVLVFAFFDWVEFDAGGFGSFGVNAFEFEFTGTLPWILVVATGVLTFLMAGGLMKPGNLPWPLLMLAATALATVLMLIRLLFNPGASGLDRALGLYVSVIGGAVALAGAFISFKESGGTLDDLKDVEKIKGQFGAGGSPTPPPAP